MQQKVDIIRFTPSQSYADILSMQTQRVTDIIAGQALETVFWGEHAPVYTCGTSGDLSDVTHRHPEIPVIKTGRGGELTYHGPGQLVVYPLLNLNTREKDLKKYVKHLQACIIETLSEYDIKAHTNDDVGVWVHTPAGEQKIAAIGIRVRKWVTFHGIALNIAPNLDHFTGIIPCGITDRGVTSMAALGKQADIGEFAGSLIQRIASF